MNIIQRHLPPSQRPVPHSRAAEINGKHTRLKVEREEIRVEGRKLLGWHVADAIMDRGEYPRTYLREYDEVHSLKTAIWFRALSSNAQAIRANATLIRSLK